MLERDRLAHRARRIELVLQALRVRAEERTRRGEPVPPALTQSIAGFEDDLRSTRMRYRGRFQRKRP
jgi:hypothetical protein